MCHSSGKVVAGAIARIVACVLLLGCDPQVVTRTLHRDNCVVCHQPLVEGGTEGGDRIVTHGIETAVLLPLTVALALAWGVTGAALAALVASLVFGLVWVGALARIRVEVAHRAANVGEGAIP